MQASRDARFERCKLLCALDASLFLPIHTERPCTQRDFKKKRGDTERGVIHTERDHTQSLTLYTHRDQKRGDEIVCRRLWCLLAVYRLLQMGPASTDPLREREG